MRKLLGFLALAIAGLSPAVAAPVATGYFQDYTGMIKPLGGVVVFNPDGTVASFGGSGSGAQQVQGPYARGSTTFANPQLVGCRASSTAPTAVSTGSNGDAWCGLNGQLVMGLNTGSSIVAAPGDATGGQYVQERLRSNYLIETSTPLAASGSYPGPARDAGVAPSQWASFKCFFSADQASASNGARIDISDNGSAWTVAVTTTLTANLPAFLSLPVFTRYSRCVLNNSTTAQTSLRISSSFGSN